MADIVHGITVCTRPGVVFPLVSTGAGFRRWWARDVRETPDGATELGFCESSTIYRLHPTIRETNRRVVWQCVYRLRPLVREPASRMHWRCETGREWEGTRLVFELEPCGPTTFVHFRHADWPEETRHFVTCNTMWGELLFRLKDSAEGKEPGPLFPKDGLAARGDLLD
jgi:hypothetical protein